MARLNAKWLDFSARGQTWDHFWQDGPAGAVAVVIVPQRTMVGVGLSILLAVISTTIVALIKRNV